MIDVHIHVVDPRLPGEEDPIPHLDLPLEPLAQEIRAEMKEAGITHALGMGCCGAPPDDPLGINGTLRLATLVPNLYPIGVADPTRIDARHLGRVEDVLKAGKVRAFKAYLGYVHQGPDSPGYVPYYRLAARYNLPFVFHTGDTLSRRAKLKYAHPLLVDEVAVDHPDVRFVLAHFGNPWLIDAAEVLYKNDNVWADLSGLLIGGDAEFQAAERDGSLRRVADEVRHAFRYTEKPDRFLYGSDWPLAPMATYRDFVRLIVPEDRHQAVFEDNARALFALEETPGARAIP